jgi:hypothetical protein
MEDDVNHEDFNTRVMARLKASLPDHMEVLRPFLVEALQQPTAEARLACVRTVINQHTAHIGNLLTSFNMTIYQNADTAERNITRQLDYLKSTMPGVLANIRNGLSLPDQVNLFSLQTGQPVAFDFRNHLTPAKPDSGRASDIGG